MKDRPKLSKQTKLSDFKNFYWKKDELLFFCRENKLPTQGSKEEITSQIEYFIQNGTLSPNKIKKISKKHYDSQSEIKLSTPVVNYKNDFRTRAFFKSHIGDKFKFNYYLRSFAKQNNDGSMKYGDLVEGYKASLNDTQKTIAKQFEYNKFQRDFYKNHNEKTRAACNKAWKLVKSAPGGSSYKDYLILEAQNDSNSNID